MTRKNALPVLIVTSLMFMHGNIVRAAAVQQQSPFPGEQAKEAAYLGDIRTLREMIDFWPKELLAKDGVPAHGDLLLMAMYGRQPDVVRMLLSYGVATFDWFSGWERLFTPDVMSAAYAELFLKAPGFKEKNGSAALELAVKAGNLAAAKVFLAAGINPDAGVSLLVLALDNRDVEMLKLLLSRGADPYARSYRNGTWPSAVEKAETLKSPVLLRLLDVRKEKTDLIRELEKKTPPVDSPFIGFWNLERQWGGTPSRIGSLELFPDGSCKTDGTFFFFLWEQTGPATGRLMSLSKANKVEIGLMIEKDALVLIPAGVEGGYRMVRGKPSALPSSGWRHPFFVRTEGAWITPDGTLVLQISGRHTSIPIDRLIETAGKSKTLLPWTDFTKGAPSPELLKDARPVPIENQSVGYRTTKEGTGLGFDNTTLVTLPPGIEYTLFRDTFDETYYEPGSTVMENLKGYYLMAATPLANGRNWLKFYLRRSFTNR